MFACASLAAISATATGRSSLWIRNPLFFLLNFSFCRFGYLRERLGVFGDEIQLGPPCAVWEGRHAKSIYPSLA